MEFNSTNINMDWLKTQGGWLWNNLPTGDQIGDQISQNKFLKAAKDYLVDRDIVKFKDKTKKTEEDKRVSTVWGYANPLYKPPTLEEAIRSYELVYTQLSISKFGGASDTGTWGVEEIDICEPTKFLRKSLERISLTHNASSNESFARHFLETIFIDTIHELLIERDYLVPPTFPTSSKQQRIDYEELGRSVPVKYETILDKTKPAVRAEVFVNTYTKALDDGRRDRKMMKKGWADYVMKFKDHSVAGGKKRKRKGKFTTAFPIVLVPQVCRLGEYTGQLVEAMGILYRSRKSPNKGHVYGLITDGMEFKFFRISEEGVLSRSPVLEWEQGDGKSILGYMRAIVENLFEMSVESGQGGEEGFKSVMLGMQGQKRDDDEEDEDEEMDGEEEEEWDMLEETYEEEKEDYVCRDSGDFGGRQWELMD